MLEGVNLVNIIFLFRTFRIFTYITEWESFDKIINTFKNISTPVISMVLSMYTVYYFFAGIGEFLFSGGITT